MMMMIICIVMFVKISVTKIRTIILLGVNT
jgi:hypothetical protein